MSHAPNEAATIDLERAQFNAAFVKLGYLWSNSNQAKAFLGWQLARAAALEAATGEQPAPVPMTREFCAAFPGAAAGIINALARQIDSAEQQPAPVQAVVRVPEIDYERLIADCYARTKAAQGTRGCVQFKLGAEWFREQLLAATPPAQPPVSAQVVEALRNLLTAAKRANEIMLHEAGIGVCDVTPIADAEAALAAVEAAEARK